MLLLGGGAIGSNQNLNRSPRESAWFLIKDVSGWGESWDSFPEGRHVLCVSEDRWELAEGREMLGREEFSGQREGIIEGQILVVDGPKDRTVARLERPWDNSFKNMVLVPDIVHPSNVGKRSAVLEMGVLERPSSETNAGWMWYDWGCAFTCRLSEVRGLILVFSILTHRHSAKNYFGIEFYIQGCLTAHICLKFFCKCKELLMDMGGGFLHGCRLVLWSSYPVLLTFSAVLASFLVWLELKSLERKKQEAMGMLERSQDTSSRDPSHLPSFLFSTSGIQGLSTEVILCSLPFLLVCFLNPSPSCNRHHNSCVTWSQLPLILQLIPTECFNCCQLLVKPQLPENLRFLDL